MATQRPSKRARTKKQDPTPPLPEEPVTEEAPDPEFDFDLQAMEVTLALREAMWEGGHMPTLEDMLRKFTEGPPGLVKLMLWSLKANGLVFVDFDVTGNFGPLEMFNFVRIYLCGMTAARRDRASDFLLKGLKMVLEEERGGKTEEVKRPAAKMASTQSRRPVPAKRRTSKR